MITQLETCVCLGLPGTTYLDSKGWLYKKKLYWKQFLYFLPGSVFLSFLSLYTLATNQPAISEWSTKQLGPMGKYGN